MKYSKSLTIKHPVSLSHPTCLKNFDNLIKNEGFDGISNVFQNDVIVLDLDCVEANIAKNERRNRNSSMDCSFAITNEKLNYCEMLMVELRFNYVNLQNLTRQKLVDKVNCSTLVLGNTISINSNCVFIFKSDLKGQAKSRLFRMLPKVPSNYIIMDIYDLRDTYFN